MGKRRGVMHPWWKNLLTRRFGVPLVVLGALVLGAVAVMSYLAQLEPGQAQHAQEAASTSNPTKDATAVPASTLTPTPTQGATLRPKSPDAKPPVDVTPPPAAAPKPAPEEVAPNQGEPTRIVYPEADISMSVVPMAVAEGAEIVPPEDSNGHWLSTYGKPGKAARDTVYIVAHSCGLGYANCSPETFPFNNLSDKAKAGQRITVATSEGDVHYRVTRTMVYPKSGPSLDKEETWAVVPDRLVLISCYTQDLLGTNFVVFAHREK